MTHKPGRTKDRGSHRWSSIVAAKALEPSLRSRRYEPSPELQLIYDTAPVGLAFLTTDCRYVQTNHRLTEICGISVADHIGRTVRETVPQVADQVEKIVQSVVRTGKPITGIEVRGQRADKLNAEHIWTTSWHPLKGEEGSVVGVNLVAEEITERKRAQAVLATSETALRESEARFHELADNVSQLVWTTDEAGRRYWYNKRWYDYTGATFEEMRGMGWQKVHHPEHLERVQQHMRRCFESGTLWEDTFPLRGRDGSYRWFLSRARPIRDDAGKVIRWFGTNTDITEQIEAEKALRELNESLGQRVEVETAERLQVWNVSQDLLVVADLEGKYLSVNQAWTATLGWRESDLLGKSSQWLLHPDDREKTRVETRQLAAGRKTVRFENRFRHKDGSYRWMSWKTTPYRGRIYGTGRDVTELKVAENELAEARRELAQTARRATVATMTAAIAQEVLQPLAAIVAHAHAGLRWLGKMPSELDAARDTFKDIVKDGHRASGVLQSVRAMFSGSNQAVTLLDTNDLITETIALVSSDLEASSVLVQTELATSLPQVYGYRDQLQHAILNIINNAADSMRIVDDRRRVLRVKSRVLESNEVMISIEDSGPGIEPRNIDRIFDAFFTTKANGMGMGLAICRSIIKAHDGTLSVTPGTPHGAVFQVVLPGSS
jgi:PAS domain S-box-containing protein